MESNQQVIRPVPVAPASGPWTLTPLPKQITFFSPSTCLPSLYNPPPSACYISNQRTHMPHPKPPVSEKQLAANRANATRSTGPRTPEGKARAAQNARKHGFTASTFAVVRLED